MCALNCFVQISNFMYTYLNFLANPIMQCNNIDAKFRLSKSMATLAAEVYAPVIVMTLGGDPRLTQGNLPF